ncbi:MAG: dTDP-4-dehydrorhamnose reductase, partial [Verrucomicrobiales bacterium]|nr:dTDP-4-dehydrorhamnose reductase [Verrucomicrobiales bacterium]
RFVLEAKPQIIVNAAAYTAVDKAESEPDLAMRINGVAPGALAEAAKQLGALLVHYSTDYVYDGTKTEPYTETDTPNPLNVYGRTKLAGDLAVQDTGCMHLIFRVCWVYSTRGKSFMRTIMQLARQQETLRVVADQIGCPTWARLIAEATALALKHVLANGDPRAFTGLYHMATVGATSWHGFAEAIVKRMPPTERKCTSVVPITTAEYPTPAKRPAYSVLSCRKLAKTFGITLPHWTEALELATES